MLIGDATKARFIAAFIDNIAAIVVMLLVVASIPEHLDILRAILLVTGYLGYFFVLEAVWGRTLGKYLQGLIVRKTDGTPGGWRESAIRTVLRVAEVNPVLLGGLPAGIFLISSERRQRLGDMLAGTVVVPVRPLPEYAEYNG